jgi:SM-20-related protein
MTNNFSALALIKQMKHSSQQSIMHAMGFTNQEHIISTILDEIANHGYAVIKDFLSHQDISALARQAKVLHSAGEMHKATTGITKVENSTLRGDFIHWIEASNASAVEICYLKAMAKLQKAINQEFFLGLFEFESHFAIYPPGTGYQKHLDQFIGKEERKVSCIFYLNDNWHTDDGGELRMYLNKKEDKRFIDITPQAGTLVVFLSSDFLHEVLPAKRERMSITGWFRTRSKTT